MFNKVILIGRLGQNAEAKTAQNNKEYVILNIATQESWKNDKGRVRNTHRMAPRLCLEESLEVRQDSSEGAARHPGRHSQVSRSRG
nr:single-stranded DNA-binding protein [Edaphobacter modestus]